MIIITKIIFIYTISIIFLYIIVAIKSSIEVFRYINSNNHVYFNNMLFNGMLPGISIIAPAYNEEQNIIGSVDALLALSYDNYEVIVVNDGSKDKSLKLLIDKYDLKKHNLPETFALSSNEIKAVYKSRNTLYENLIVVDKLNGGKADALNCGINFSQYNYFLSIDADSIVTPDTFLRLSKVLLDERDEKIIAVGGMVRVFNTSEIEGGFITNIRSPKRLLPLFQVTEYTRSFMLMRVGLSMWHSLLVVSGALCLFEKNVVIKTGGYDTKSVGEDMELVVHVQKYMLENNKKYRVVQTPDPLCWTEVPETLNDFFSQRARWMRGLIDTMRKHKKVLFSYKYKELGLIGFPIFILFDLLTIFVEVFGIVYFLILAYNDRINWLWALFYMLICYFFAVFYSTYTIILDELVCRKYGRVRDILKLCLVAIIEPIFFHPLVLISGIRGNIQYYFFKKKKWGKMTRKGFKDNLNLNLNKEVNKENKK